MPEAGPLKTILVVPCYNEAQRFRSEEFAKALKEDPFLGVLFVDDGSSDQTADVLNSFVKRYPLQSSLYRLPVNQGKAEAVRLGVVRLFDKKAFSENFRSAQYFGYWDADLATPFREVKRFLDVFSTRPNLLLVMGARVNLLGRNVKRNPFRHYLSRVFATAASLALNLPVYDTQCGAKLFRFDQKLGKLFEKPFVSGWIFDVELLARLVTSLNQHDPSQYVYELPLLEWEDVAGSKIRSRDFFKATMSLFRIARLYPRVSSNH